MNSRYPQKFNNANKASKLLKEHDEEENKGFKLKGPARKPHHFDDADDDIEEEIHSDADNDRHRGSGGGESSSARGFGITVSQSLGIDKSVDSMAIDEYDHIENIEE